MPADPDLTGIPPEFALPPLREVIARHGLTARKSLGQNFLLDLNLTGKIARAAGDLRGRDVLEVGAGPGGLTRALLAQGAKRVIAVEMDNRCIAALEELATAYSGRLIVVQGDALEYDELSVLQRPAKIVANLPYNVATPLLFKWLAHAGSFESMTLLFQKEVAQRIAATPGGKTFGRLSVMSQWRCEVTRLFDIPGSAFVPPPKVTSTLIQLRPRPQPLAPADAELLEKVVAVAFGQRRKMLRAALRPLVPAPEAFLESVGIPPTQRAEQLSVEQFCALARAFAELTGTSVPRAGP